MSACQVLKDIFSPDFPIGVKTSTDAVQISDWHLGDIKKITEYCNILKSTADLI